MSNEEKAIEIIKLNRYMSLATSDLDGNSWNSPVSFCVNSKFEFFFQSALDCNHVDNIRFNPIVSIAIYDSHVPVEFLDGVQMTGYVEMIDIEELETVYQLFISQVLNDEERSRIAPPIKAFCGEDFPVLRFFKFVPKEAYKKDLTINGVARRVNLNIEKMKEYNE